MAISALKFYTEEPNKPSPSYFVLELIDKKIPIVSYVKVRENFRRYVCMYNYVY